MDLRKIKPIALTDEEIKQCQEKAEQTKKTIEEEKHYKIIEKNAINYLKTLNEEYEDTLNLIGFKILPQLKTSYDKIEAKLVILPLSLNEFNEAKKRIEEKRSKESGIIL